MALGRVTALRCAATFDRGDVDRAGLPLLRHESAAVLLPGKALVVQPHGDGGNDLSDGGRKGERKRE